MKEQNFQIYNELNRKQNINENEEFNEIFF